MGAQGGLFNPTIWIHPLLFTLQPLPGHYLSSTPAPSWCSMEERGVSGVCTSTAKGKVERKRLETCSPEEKKNAEYQMNEREGESLVIKTLSGLRLILSAHVLISMLVNPGSVQPLCRVPARLCVVGQPVSRIFDGSTFRCLVCAHLSLLIVKWRQTYQHGVSGIIKQRLGVPVNPCTHLWLGTGHFLGVRQLICVPPSLV